VGLSFYKMQTSLFAGNPALTNVLFSTGCVQFMCHYTVVSPLAFGECPLSDLAVWKRTHTDEGS
jgi:hypothetical protein